EVRELEVDLVARRGPVREPDADLLPLEHWTALVPALGHQRDRRAREIGAELLERVEVRVRSEQADVAAAHETVETRLELLALVTRLREAGREDDRELRLALQHLLERVDGRARKDDREVDVAGDVEHAPVD